MLIGEKLTLYYYENGKLVHVDVEYRGRRTGEYVFESVLYGDKYVLQRDHITIRKESRGSTPSLHKADITKEWYYNLF